MNKPNISNIHISRLLPSFVTIIGLCLGITSIRYALDAQWNIAAGLIFIAAIMDAIDGRLARLLKVTSNFGAQIDSLADMVSFGVAPAVVMYLWSLHGIPYKGLGWSVVLLYIACSALRLARFNSSLEDEDAKKKMQRFFVGVPIPAAAVLAILPMISTLELMPNIYSYWFVSAYICLVGVLMISTVPTFSMKTTYIKRNWLSFTLVLMVMLIAGILLEPWIVIPILCIIYLISIPCSIYDYYKHTDKV